MSRLAASLCLALLTLGELRVFDRLYFEVPKDYEFVLLGVTGVLSGTPVSKSWQHRLLAPSAIAAIASLTGDRLLALRIFFGAMVLSANVLLFLFVRRKGSSLRTSLLAVAGFGLLHVVSAYKLEYPWDGVDVLLFLAFGYWVRSRGSIRSLVPLLLLGTVNHETILYVPLFCVLSALERTRKSVERGTLLTFGISGAIAAGAAIFGLREALYVGRPNLPGQQFELPTPVIENHLHVGHNLRQLFIDDWKSGRAFIAISVLSATATLIALVSAKRDVTAALWSLSVIVTIMCFGYVNETRHYLLLVAFWCAYGVVTPPPPPAARRVPATPPSGMASAPPREPA